MPPPLGPESEREESQSQSQTFEAAPAPEVHDNPPRLPNVY
jgi:hypothetical protein